jgi:membrane-associated phospholipid phosphatase
MNQTIGRQGWAAELRLRVRSNFLLKAAGTTLVIALFFVAYFYLQQHPAYPVTTMPLTLLDLQIEPHAFALIPYLSLWIYVGVGPGLQRTPREAAIYGVWIAAMCIAGLAVFYFWPTQVPQFPEADASGALVLLKHVDAAGNAFPSLHVAAATFTMIRLSALLRRIGAPSWLRALNFVWFILIAWSTVATRQHVALDVAGGAALGLFFSVAALRFSRASAAYTSTNPGRPSRGGWRLS